MPELRGLYVIIDPAACLGRDPVSVARAALEGGASMLQWRDKLRDKGEQLPDARRIWDLCQAADAAFIINDHADLALVLHSDAHPEALEGLGLGVHVGQKDLPVAEVRRIVPPDFIVGASTNNVEEARAAKAAGASYIAVGDLFGTQTKGVTRRASPKRLAEVKRAVGLPVIGIGGINIGNIAQVMAAGADGVSVISAVCSAADPAAAAAELVQAMRQTAR